MRVATNAYTDSMLNQFNNLAAKQYTLQNQASTGLAVQAPSDNPVAMQNTLGLRLESGKGPVEYLIVDRAEKPTPN